MDDIEIETVASVDPTDPVLVEGLPGVGHVGKLAADQILEEFEEGCTLVRRIYSSDLPPQVAVEDGVATLTATDIYHVEPPTGRELLVVTGDHQAQSPPGHYRVTEAILDVAQELECAELYALGGVPTGELIEEYDVVGAVGDASEKEPLEAAGVEFREKEPAGGIVGVSGLLVGLGTRRDMTAACLMGETSGYLVDPKSARAVLEVLEELLGFELAYESLDDRAERMEEVVAKIREIEGGQPMEAPTDEDLRYFG